MAVRSLPPGLEPIRRVVILRANGIGDLVFSLPALWSIRRAYPEAEITLLAREWHCEFLAGRPAPVDRVVPLPPIPGVTAKEGDRCSADTRGEFVGDLRREAIDLAVQLHGGGAFSNPFICSLGARFTVGLQAPGAPPLDRSVAYVYYQPEILRCLEVAAAAGAPATMLEPRLDVTPADLHEALALAPAQPFVVLHAGAGDPRRRWPPERFAEVARALLSNGLEVVVTGAGLEWQAAREVEQRAAGVTNVCGRLSLSGLAGLLSRAALVISNDSGPLHLAEAVGTPTVGIYWCGNVINAGPITRDRHRPLLSWRLECPVCSANTISRRCEHDGSFVDLVSVAEVIEQARDLLQTARPAPMAAPTGPV